MKSRICDISVARCEDRSWLLDPDSQISSEHGIDIWHGEKIWSLWPNPSPTPLWKRNEMLARLSFQIYRATIFYIRCKNSYNPQNPLWAFQIGLRSIQRCLYCRFYIRGLIYHRFRPQRWIEWIRKFYSLLLCCCRAETYGFPWGCFFDRVSKGAKGSETRSKLLKLFGETLTVVWKGIWDEFSILFLSCDRRFVFYVMRLMRVCVFLVLLLYTCAR